MKNDLLVKNAAWLMVLQGVNILLPFVTVPYITRVFGADLYGIFSLALNWITYFQVIVEYGFNLSATRRIALSRSNEERGLIATSVVWSRAIILVVSFVLAILLGLFFSVDGRQLSCTIVLFSMLFGIAIQLNWYFQGMQDMKVITLATAFARICSVVLIFLLINNPDQLNLYAFLYSVTFLLSGLITHLVAFKKYNLRIGFPTISGLSSAMKDGCAIFVSSAAGKAIGSVGVTVLGTIASSAVVGSYSAVLKLPQLVSMMFAPISQAIYPHVSQQFSHSRHHATKFVFKVSIPVVLTFAVALLLLVVARVPLVSLLFGDEYLICVDALMPLSLWVLLGIVNNFIGILLLIPMGKQNAYSMLMVANIICSLVLNLAMGSMYGFMGIASAAALGEGILTISLAFALFLELRGKNEK